MQSESESVPSPASEDSAVTTLSELEEDHRFKNFNSVKKCFKYIDQAVQGFIVSRFKIYLWPKIRDLSNDEIFVLLRDLKSNSKKTQIQKASDLLTVGSDRGDSSLVKETMRFYLPKNYSAVDGQYDTSSLKMIMMNCKLFTDPSDRSGPWADPHEKPRGWFQTFYDVVKIRNKVIGHNAPQRVETSDLIDHFRLIESMFKELLLLCDDYKCISKTEKCYREIFKNYQNKFDEIWENCSDPGIKKCLALATVFSNLVERSAEFKVYFIFWIFSLRESWLFRSENLFNIVDELKSQVEEYDFFAKLDLDAWISNPFRDLDLTYIGIYDHHYSRHSPDPAITIYEAHDSGYQCLIVVHSKAGVGI